MSSPSFVVTGCAGFIGSHFCDHVLNVAGLNARVVGVDKMCYAALPENMQDAVDDRRFDFVREDISDHKAMRDLLKVLRPMAVFNFAAESHVDRSNQGGEEFVQSNVAGVQSIAEACKQLKDANRPITFVQIGTDEVYGSLESGSATTESGLNPNSLYSSTKASGDLVALSYFRTHEMDVRVTRCTNNYGPRQFPEKLVPVMVYKAMDDEALPIYGDGKQIRDWMHVTDHCRGIWAAYQRGRPGRVYHFAAGNEIDNLTIISTILEALGKPADLVAHVADRLGHDRRYSLDSSVSERELGWRPMVEFSSGLAETVEWYRDNHRMRDVFREVMSGEYARKNYDG